MLNVILCLFYIVIRKMSRTINLHMYSFQMVQNFIETHTTNLA